MNREDILHLGELSRISLTEKEVAALETELSAIVSYVSTVTDIAADEADKAPQVGARYNVLRPDVVTNQSDQHTDAILGEMPDTKGRHLKVKKILKSKEK
jgi:aspartyl-tRNA(Asn)/glutamyl-tRNA(Gln) amidotransferase subunit C